MRTTVTLDEDTARMIRDAMRRTQRSFKVTLNEAIRNGLNRASEQRPAFRVHARPLGLRIGIDPARMHEHDQDAEEERFSASPTPYGFEHSGLISQSTCGVSYRFLGRPRAGQHGTSRMVYTRRMQLEEIVTEALKLSPRSRARLAGELLQSLDQLTAQQNEEIWAEEAVRRDLEPESADRPAAQVFEELRHRLS